MTIFWFRRDLRMEDNKGLFDALSASKNVLPIFIFDKNILDQLPKDDARVSFIQELLEKLNVELQKKGKNLAVFYGNPLSIFEKLTIEKETAVVTEKNKGNKWLSYLLIMTFITIVFFIDGKINNVLYIILRSLAVTMMLFVIARPIIVSLINYFGKNKKEDFTKVMILLPEIRSYVKPSFVLAKKSFNGLKRYKYFVLYLIHFSISDNIDD